MAALIRLDSQLHTPMHFFLCHLSLVDLGNSSAVARKTLVSFFGREMTFLSSGCAAQMYLCGVCIITKCYVLAAMAYDRTMIFMYLPSSSSSPDQDKVVSVVYTLVIPMLNPLIYSLRNMEVKDALERLLEKVLVSFRNQTGKEVS
ncbi:olfactory receptor 5B21-like [Ciconia maguari]